VGGPVIGTSRHPPPLYRLARVLRWASILALVLLLVFVATVAYSAVSLARSSSNLTAVTTSFAANDTLVVIGTLTLSNSGYYPVSDLTLAVRVTNANASPAFLGSTGLGPVALAGQSTTAYVLRLYVPATGVGPAATLLTQDQQIRFGVWANATYAYLFPSAIAFTTNESWGAPFSHLTVSVGAARVVNGTPTASVTLSFENEAAFTIAGSLQFAILSSAGRTCGGSAFPLDVSPHQQYSQTEPVSLAPGCNPSGGEVIAEYVTPSYAIPLPAQEVP
jgi:hypothetical protein